MIITKIFTMLSVIVTYEYFMVNTSRVSVNIIKVY